MSAVFQRCLLLLLLLAGAAHGQTAVVEGRVALPNAKSAPVANKRYEVVSRGGVLSISPPLAVVYLEGVFPAPVQTPLRQVEQKGFMFLPALLPVQAGTRVAFPNLDDAYHNVFSYSPAKRFDLGRYRPDEKPVPSQLFDKPGLVTLHCDIHEHMRGIILVLDTPHFVTTAPDGSFRLQGLPPGTWRLKAWINSKTTLDLPVVLKPGALVKASFP